MYRENHDPSPSGLSYRAYRELVRDRAEPPRRAAGLARPDAGLLLPDAPLVSVLALLLARDMTLLSLLGLLADPPLLAAGLALPPLADALLFVCTISSFLCCNYKLKCLAKTAIHLLSRARKFPRRHLLSGDTLAPQKRSGLTYLWRGSSGHY